MQTSVAFDDAVCAPALTFAFWFCRRLCKVLVLKSKLNLIIETSKPQFEVLRLLALLALLLGRVVLTLLQPN